jgi:hypothetical protein
MTIRKNQTKDDMAGTWKAMDVTGKNGGGGADRCEEKSGDLQQRQS